MNESVIPAVLVLVQLVWLVLTWRSAGFLAALNLFLFGTLVAIGAGVALR